MSGDRDRSEHPRETEERRGEMLGVFAFTYFGVTLLTLAATAWGLPGMSGKEGAGRTLALIGAASLVTFATIALAREPLSRLALHTRAAIVAFGVLASIPAWIWIFSR